MKQRLSVRAAAFCTAALLASGALAGCSFRPVGAGRSDVTSAPETKDVGGTPDTTGHPETSRPDTTASDTTESDTTADVGTTASSRAPETAAPSPAPTEARLSLVAVGDNIIHEAVFLDAKARAADGASYDFLPMYNGVADRIAAADVAFVNHETPMAGAEYGISGYPTFNAPREAGQALADVGFDVVNLANNHILDKRVAGARATVEFVRTLPVLEIGVYLDRDDARQMRITEKNGIRIAWLSYCYGSNNSYNPATDDIIMPLLDQADTIRSEVRAARAAADFVIVSAHWGLDDVAAVTDDQKRMASVIAEAGADVILGHHPHILQPVEWHENANGSRTLIVFSLGNFLSTQYYSRNMIGGMISFDLVKGTDGTCAVESPVLYPTVTHYSMQRDGLQIYMLEDYTETLAARHGCLAHSADFSLAWIYRHVRSIVKEEFLPAYFE